MSDTCPVCGKGDSEQFFAGYEDEHEVWGGRYVSHLTCVEKLEAELAALKAENASLRKRLDDCLREHYGLNPARAEEGGGE